MKHKPVTYKYPKLDRMAGLDKSEFKMASLRSEWGLFVEIDQIEKNRRSAPPNPVFLARNYRQISNTGHQLLIMKFDATNPKNMNTDAAPAPRPTDQKAMDQAFLDVAYQHHWSTRLVRAWAELLRIQRKLAEDTGVQDGTRRISKYFGSAADTGHNHNV